MLTITEPDKLLWIVVAKPDERWVMQPSFYDICKQEKCKPRYKTEFTFKLDNRPDGTGECPDKMAAIKGVRQTLGFHLLEAKQFVEQLIELRIPLVIYSHDEIWGGSTLI